MTKREFANATNILLMIILLASIYIILFAPHLSPTVRMHTDAWLYRIKHLYKPEY